MVLSNSKHTMPCLYGHIVLARTNLMPLKTLWWFAPWRKTQNIQGTVHFLYAKSEKKRVKKYGKKIEYDIKSGIYAIKQYFSATKLHFLIFIITFASKTY